MQQAHSYQEWHDLALQLDGIDGCVMVALQPAAMHADRSASVRRYDVWKMRFESTEYDYVLIRDYVNELYRARKQHDVRAALHLLRTTLHRNVGNLMSDNMYLCATGTKVVSSFTP
jgi:hypothetical protein